MAENRSGWLNSAAEMFGFELKRRDFPDQSRNALPEPVENDGALDITSNYGGGAYGFGATGLDYEVPQDEVKLITKYRELSREMEFETAISDIVNEAFSYDNETYPVKLNITDNKLSESTKKKIYDEFENILGLLNFEDDAYETFRRWYVDGRLYYQKIIDPKAPTKGITQLKYIDPRKIKKIRKRKNQQSATVQGVELTADYEEYYLYNPKGINPTNPAGLKVSLDAITFIHSGIFTKDNKTILSHIHKAIRFFNGLRNLENALVIYRMTRAPERRVFNVETGQLPPATAQKYLGDLMNKFRKKLSYDPSSGDVLEQKRYMSMQEDFWFAKRDGKGTTVDVLQGGQNLGQMEDVEYFKKKLYESLNVPISRMDAASGFTIGRASEITRDELKFSKFISRLRKRFSGLFDDILKTQLILKKIVTAEEWTELSKHLQYNYIQDNQFTELKDSEIFNNRFQTLQQINDYVGVFVTKKWAATKILNFTEDEWTQMQEDLAEERENDIHGGVVPPPPGEGGDEGQDQGQEGGDPEPSDEVDDEDVGDAYPDGKTPPAEQSRQNDERNAKPDKK